MKQKRLNAQSLQELKIFKQIMKLILILLVLVVVLEKNKVVYWTFEQYVKQSYCIAWSVEKKHIVKNQGLQKKNKGKLMILSKRAVSHTKKSGFIKEKEASGLLSRLGINTPLSKINLVGPLLF